MVQEEQKIISLLSEPIKIAGFDLIEVKVGMLNAQNTIQLYIDSPNGCLLYTSDAADEL